MVKLGPEYWQSAQVEERDAGFAILIQEKPVKTPAKRDLILPTAALAEAVAAEWRAQDGAPVPASMPVTRSANSALDKVGPQFKEVADMIAAYGETDLLCYRAEAPQDLVQHQAEAWDPWLAWASQTYNAPLTTIIGVIHKAQPPAALARLSAEVHALSPFQLTALHDLVAISGSLILGLAVQTNALSAETAWALSRIDEDWQSEHWGWDAEAAEVTAVRKQDFLAAERLNSLL